MSNPAIDPRVLEAFTTAVTTTFEQLTGILFEAVDVTTTTGKPVADQSSVYLDLQRTKPGVVILELSPALATILTERFFPSTEQPNPELCDDALREFINVIAGQAKTMLKGTSYHYLLSIPRSGYPMMDQEVFSIRFVAVEGSLVLRLWLPACDE